MKRRGPENLGSLTTSDLELRLANAWQRLKGFKLALEEFDKYDDAAIINADLKGADNAFKRRLDYIQESISALETMVRELELLIEARNKKIGKQATRSSN